MLTAVRYGFRPGRANEKPGALAKGSLVYIIYPANVSHLFMSALQRSRQIILGQDSSPYMLKLFEIV